MDQKFEIIKIIDIQDRGQFIFARQMNTGQDFEVKVNSTLGGVLLDRYLDLPRKLDVNGHLCTDVFVFRPLARIPFGYFKKGELVKLIAPQVP